MEIGILYKILEYTHVKKAALCTQIDWKGSVPRKDYPMMLVDYDSNIIGTIGGGALEHSSIELSKSVIETGKPLLKEFDLTNQDITISDSICGGTTTILIEPYSRTIIDIFKSVIDSKSSVLLTQISNDENMIINREIVSAETMGNSHPKNVVKIVDEVTKTGNPRSFKIENNYFLIQNFTTKPILHIFGAGHVGQAVADLAHFIDLDTKIYDEREDLINIDRFPYAVKLVCDNLENIITSTEIEESDYILVATRGHKHDFELMQWLLNKKVEYISLVSSNKKWQLLAEALIKYGIPNEKIKEVYSPVGLDIGSETVPEIAVSIISEIINYYRKEYKSEISLSK